MPQQGGRGDHGVSETIAQKRGRRRSPRQDSDYLSGAWPRIPLRRGGGAGKGSKINLGVVGSAKDKGAEGLTSSGCESRAFVGEGRTQRRGIRFNNSETRHEAT